MSKHFFTTTYKSVHAKTHNMQSYSVHYSNRNLKFYIKNIVKFDNQLFYINYNIQTNYFINPYISKT